MPATRKSLLIQLRDLSNEEQWKEFLQIYEPLIVACCRRHGVAHSATDDILQEVVCQLLKTIGSFQLDDTKGRFRSWLSTIVMNKIRDHFRRQKWRAYVDSEARLENLMAKASTAGEDAEHGGILERAMTIVEARSHSKTWNCFVEHHLQQRPAADVAEELNLTVDAVYANTLRTKIRIQELVQKMKG